MNTTIPAKLQSMVSFWCADLTVEQRRDMCEVIAESAPDATELEWAKSIDELRLQLLPKMPAQQTTTAEVSVRMPVTADDFAKLSEDLDNALVMARVVAETSDDNGTCNFDAVQFSFDRSPTAKVRAAFDKALATVGLSAMWCENAFGKGKNRRLVFGPGCGGQGNSRTRAAETMRRELVRHGWAASMYYQAD